MAEVSNTSPVRLDVMVTAYGLEAMQRLSEPGRLEATPGVRYLISWQPGPGDISGYKMAPELTSRRDVLIEKLAGQGLSRNRNNLLRMASAPYLLCADDDVQYKSENLLKIIATLDANPEVDIAVFRISVDEPRRYPKRKCRLSYSGVSRTFYPYSCEVAMRRESLDRVGLRFDEHFGINAPVLGAGEDDVFLYDAWRLGLNLTYFPIEILRHPGTTSVHSRKTPSVYMARGAVMYVLHPRTATLRILKLAAILSKGHPAYFGRMFRLMMKGRSYAASLNREGEE